MSLAAHRSDAHIPVKIKGKRTGREDSFSTLACGYFIMGIDACGVTLGLDSGRGKLQIPGGAGGGVTGVGYRRVEASTDFSNALDITVVMKYLGNR